MTDLILLTDGSVNARTGIGYGAFLAVTGPGLPQDLGRERVQVRRFAPTTSTKLELQTLLWALGAIPARVGRVTVYTDAQHIIGLPGRRQRLVERDYYSGKNKRFNNYELYQEFYRMIDRLVCKFVKVRGHQQAGQKDGLDRLFTLVDRASRAALREDQEIKMNHDLTSGKPGALP